jgi:pimeloyl-ACP methyl ester carboxylesterase
VALAPAGGWAPGDGAYRETLAHFTEMQALVRQAAPHADALVATPEGRRRASADVAERFEHIPAELLAHQIRGAAACTGAAALIESAYRDGWPLAPERIACPVRIVWGTADRLLGYPRAARRYREDWLPHADWVELDGVGHCPQLDVPLEAAELILGWTSDG